MSMKKGTFAEGGQAICIAAIGVSALFMFFKGQMIDMAINFLPYVFGVSAFGYLFYKLNLE